MSKSVSEAQAVGGPVAGESLPESGVEPSRVRQLWHLLEPLHAVLYYAPEAFEEAAALGLGTDERWPSYFPFRAAPLGAVGAGQVASAFYSFSPRMVARYMDAVWATGGVEKATSGGAAPDPPQPWNEPQHHDDGGREGDQGDRREGGDVAHGVLQGLSGIGEAGAGVGRGLERLLQRVPDEGDLRGRIAGVVEIGGKTVARALGLPSGLGQRQDRVTDDEGELHRDRDQEQSDQVRDQLTTPTRWGLGVQTHGRAPVPTATSTKA
ncbi:hypothetical protein [Streptomyces sp. NPDC005568]|uniref:helix-turn-helix domain-containing protein n=1 Tax=Streptomyces sp. NPDC005568 TaxID=3156887 RepID=UPI0033B49A51